MIFNDQRTSALRIIIILMLLGSMLIGGAKAHEFVLKIPSVQWYFDNPSGIAVDSN